LVSALGTVEGSNLEFFPAFSLVNSSSAMWYLIHWPDDTAEKIMKMA
jgi:hypothetical protein